jgi:branched-chain amino acid aminotransferase
MQMTLSFPITRVAKSRVGEVDFENLVFGKEPTDHMFVAEYAGGGWQEPRFEPFHDLRLSPFTLALHYGQTVFEGMKAFRREDGGISIFRIEKHYARFARSLERMCMPVPPYELFEQALIDFIALEHAWVPNQPESALYLRPFMIASESKISAKVSDEYLFLIVASPVGRYYSQPLRVKVELDFLRAAEGGTGYAKCGGNYGGAFYPTQQARRQGFDQVLWTDSTHTYFEESGTMNLMFVVDGTVWTPPLTSTILDGVTRDSILELARARGLRIEERRVAWRELEAALRAGARVEAFGAGTAAVIAPIGFIQFADAGYACYTEPDAYMYAFKDELHRIRTGQSPDPYGWNHVVEVE